MVNPAEICIKWFLGELVAVNSYYMPPTCRLDALYFKKNNWNQITHHNLSLPLQGSRVCAWEAFRELAERRTRLGDFEEPLLGHTDPPLGQRWLWGGQENTKRTDTHLLCFNRVLNVSNVSLYWAEITQFVCVMTKYQVSYSFSQGAHRSLGSTHKSIWAKHEKA